MASSQTQPLAYTKATSCPGPADPQLKECVETLPGGRRTRLAALFQTAHGLLTAAVELILSRAAIVPGEAFRCDLPVSAQTAVLTGWMSLLTNGDLARARCMPTIFEGGGYWMTGTSVGWSLRCGRHICG
jgi:hypothetical protein